MSGAPVRVTTTGGIARVVLDRADRHNAFDDRLIAELTVALDALAHDPEIRVVVLAAEGKSFSAGADLNWMRRMADLSEEENLADAHALALLMRTLAELPRPTIALVQGAAFGGGVGLVAAADIAIASTTAVFALSEVRLGIVPAVISPYVVRAIGPRAASRYFLTAERFDATEAHRIGLVHKVVAPEELEPAASAVIEALMAGGPKAVEEAKSLIRAVEGRPPAGVIDDCAQLIARLRASPEGREGIGAFLERRRPSWIKEPQG